MLDGQVTQLKTYRAKNEKIGASVTFKAINRDEAKQMLISNKLSGYKIVSESTPHETT